MTSIRRHLLIWLISAVAVAGVLAGIATYRSALAEFNETFDYQLRQLALSARAQAPYQTRGDSRGSDLEMQFMVQSWNRNRVLLFRSHADDEPPFTEIQGYSTVPSRIGDLRVFTLVSEGQVFQTAQPLGLRRAMAAESALRILLPILGLIPVLALIVWFGLKRGLAPLANAAQSVSQRRADALTPLPVEALPDEVRPLVVAINGLMHSLDHALVAQRQLTADAAHELRSPLTAITLQIQLLEQTTTAEDRRDAIDELKRGSARANHLLEQLLSLARLEPGANPASSRPLETVDVAALAKSVVLDYQARAEAGRIDLGALAPVAVHVLAEPGTLRTLLSNLVDNAVRYTPPDGKIDVMVRRERQQAIIEVADTGPGIPEAEQQRVFDRFYRVPGSPGSGSGLGLAIVKTIVDQYGGSVGLENAASPTGLRVTVALPATG